MFQTAVLASGSKGNCSIVRTRNTAILFDAGLSYSKTCTALTQLNISPQDIKAVIISHEHSDHIKGIGPLCRKLKLPVFITKPTYEASSKHFRKIPSEIVFFTPGDYINIGDMEIHPFPSSHDAIDACNFTVVQKSSDISISENSNKSLPRKLAVATDLGFCTKLLTSKLQNATTIILESNHDAVMLMSGKYPWHLKQRVRSINGHLSNDQAVGLLSQILHPALDNLILAHLSEENNHPSIVEKVFTEYLSTMRSSTRFYISSQISATPILNI